LNQRDKLFKELTGVKKSLEVIASKKKEKFSAAK
jgi:hypothetical protein